MIPPCATRRGGRKRTSCACLVARRRVAVWCELEPLASRLAPPRPPPSPLAARAYTRTTLPLHPLSALDAHPPFVSRARCDCLQALWVMITHGGGTRRAGAKSKRERHANLALKLVDHRSLLVRTAARRCAARVGGEALFEPLAVELLGLLKELEVGRDVRSEVVQMAIRAESLLLTLAEVTESATGRWPSPPEAPRAPHDASVAMVDIPMELLLRCALHPPLPSASITLAKLGLLQSLVTVCGTRLTYETGRIGLVLLGVVEGQRGHGERKASTRADTRALVAAYRVAAEAVLRIGGIAVERIVFPLL